MLAQVRDNSAGGEDLLRERRERTQMRVTGRPTKQTGSEIEGHGIPIANKSKSVVGFEHGDAEAIVHVSQSALQAAVARALSSLPLTDLTVEDPPLEDVMRDLFAQGRAA